MTQVNVFTSTTRSTYNKEFFCNQHNITEYETEDSLIVYIIRYDTIRYDTIR